MSILSFRCSEIQVLNFTFRLVFLRRVYKSCFWNCWYFIVFYIIFTSQYLRKQEWTLCKNDGYWTLSGLWPPSCPNRKWIYFVIPLTNSPPQKVKTDVSRRALGSPHGSSSTSRGSAWILRGPPSNPKESPRVIWEPPNLPRPATNASFCTLTVVGPPWRALLKRIIFVVHNVCHIVVCTLTVVGPPWLAILERTMFDVNKIDSRCCLYPDCGERVLAGLAQKRHFRCS